MNKLVYIFLFVAVLGFSNLKASEVQLQGISIEYGERRPFSFYYPYNYKYYYPRQEYYEEKPHCYWRWTGREYVYECEHARRE